MGLTGPCLLGLTIWILTIAPTIVVGDHYCYQQELKYDEEDRLCSDIWTLVMNETTYTFMGTLDNQPVRSSDLYQMCRFKKKYHERVRVCCDGWTGSTCNIPDCQPPCQNGGVCVPPTSIWETLPKCSCPEGLYGGLSCEEDLSAIDKGNLMYCYVDSGCRSNFTAPYVMGITECCSGDFKGAWGSFELEDCSPCQGGDVIVANPDLDMVTCMTSGDDMYRSFNNIIYNYHALCSIELFKSQEISIYSMTECDPLNKCACYKVVTIDYTQMSGIERYILDNNTITVQTDNEETVINVELSESEEFQNIDATGAVAWKYDRIQDTIYFKITMLALSLRLDPDGTLMITVKHKATPLSGVTGICGDWNLRPEDLVGLRTKLGAEKLFKDHINEDLPCGAGLAECPSDSVMDEAREACKPLHTLFHRCHRYVDVNYYMKKCVDYFCSSANIGREQAEKAACNAISSYSTACFMENNEVIHWQSASLCPKDCKHPFVFNPLIVSACPPKCGATNLSYMKESCETVPHSGCECPLGYLRINYTCVQDDECQCVGDDQRYYNYGMEIDSVDHCLTCKCESRGLWNCQESAEQCMATCKIMDRSHVTTFDGYSYAIEDSCGQFTLAESADGDLKIEMDSSPCEVSSLGIRTCPSIFTIRYKGHEHALEITPSGFYIDNGFTRKVYIRQVSDSYAVADIHGGHIRLIVSTTGVVHMKMKGSIYKGYVHGICGNLDGNKDNEFSAVTNAPLDKASFMAQFSKCSANQIDVSDYPPVSSSDSFCSFLANAVIPPTSRINVDDYKKICASMDDDAKCSLLESFAMELDSNVKLEFPDLADCFPGCQRKEIDLCAANCRDLPYSNCQSQTIYDCGCSEGEYRTDDGHCVEMEQCGCYDFDDPDVHIPTGDDHIRGCKKCVCSDSQLMCEDSCKDIMCLKGQRSQNDIMNNRTGEECSSWRCPKPYHVSLECIDVESSPQLCFCGRDQLQSRTGICVDKCPCSDGKKWYNHGESFEMNCQKMTCNHGAFYVEETADCSRTCVLTGSELKIKQFDSDTLKSEPIVGMCELVAFRIDQGYSVTFKPVTCQSDGTVCIYMISIYTPNLQHQIQLKTTKPNTVTVDGKEYVNNVGPDITIVDTNYYLGILFSDLFAIFWNRGLTLMIEASSKLMHKTQGLCGIFNLIASDDMTGSDMLPKQSMKNFAQSWRVDQDCHMPTNPPLSTECDKESRRYAWATHKCSIILSPEEAFGSCLSENAAQSYFENCRNQACNCNNGGDCECLCDALSTYAKFCAGKGHMARWRNQRLCPMQCDGGAVYQACGDTCPKACGGSINSSLCDSLSCSEGCFCPDGYVRSNLRNIEESMCVPESECPCVDEYGRVVPAGKTETINCQFCECVNGSLTCSGEPCATNCTEDQFGCENGHCIIREFVCDGVIDCPYSEDEFNCPVKNCTGYPCKNGQCVPSSAVCDERVDCLDGTDEESCYPTCEDGEFECMKACIPMAYVCDTVRDCLYGEDEEDCVICPKNETHCNQTVCIPKDYACDGHDDCGDGSDEVGCTFPTTTTPVMCEHEEKEITEPRDYVLLDGGPTFADTAFTLQGWESTSPGGDTLTIRLSGDGYKMLEQLSFVVKEGKGSELSVVIETSTGKFDLQEVIDIGEDVELYLRKFDTEFVSIAITTTATISKLALKVCYEVPESTTVPTTSTTEKPVVCEEGFVEVNDTFEPSEPVGSTFLLNDAKYVPLPGSDKIEFTLTLRSNVIESEILDVFFDLVDGSSVVVEEIGTSGTLNTEYIDLADRSRFVYTTSYPTDLQSIRFAFDAIETTSVDYLGSKGCVKVKVCELGDCFGICYEDIPDRCASECPTDDCTTTPERTTSTIAQTTVCAHPQTVRDELEGIPNTPYFKLSTAKLFINELRNSDIEVIDYQLFDLVDPSSVQVLRLDRVVPGGEAYTSPGGLKAFKVKVYDTDTLEVLAPDTEFIEGIKTEHSEVYKDPRTPDTYFKIDSTVAGARYESLSGEPMEVYDMAPYADESFGPGNYEPEAFWTREEIKIESQICGQTTTPGATTGVASTQGPSTSTGQTTTPGATTGVASTQGPSTSPGTQTSPLQKPETSTTPEKLTEMTFETYSTAVSTRPVCEEKNVDLSNGISGTDPENRGLFQIPSLGEEVLGITVTVETSSAPQAFVLTPDGERNVVIANGQNMAFLLVQDPVSGNYVGEDVLGPDVLRDSFTYTITNPESKLVVGMTTEGVDVNFPTNVKVYTVTAVSDSQTYIPVEDEAFFVIAKQFDTSVKTVCQAPSTTAGTTAGPSSTQAPSSTPAQSTTATPTTGPASTQGPSTPGVTPPCADDEMKIQPVSQNFVPSSEAGDSVIQQLSYKEFVEFVQVNSPPPVGNKPWLLRRSENDVTNVDGGDNRLFIITEKEESGVTPSEGGETTTLFRGTTEEITGKPVKIIEDLATRFWDMNIFDGLTMSPVRVYELLPDPDTIYRLRYDQDFDVFTGQKFDFNESFLIEDSPDVLLVLRPANSAVEVKQCAAQPTTAGQTTGPSTPPGKVCADIVNLSDDELSKMPIEIRTEGPTPDSENPLGWTDAMEDIVLIVQLPIGGNFTAIDVLGTYDSFTVELQTATGTTRVKNIDDSYDFTQATRNEFDEVIEDESNLIFTFTGPDTGFRVEVTELRICINEFEFCRLTAESVYGQLQFYLADNILGVSDDNVTVVKYSDGGDELSFIETGVVVTGSCYKCTCMGYTLICQRESNCEECPDYTTQCVGNCIEAELVAIFDPPGVPDSCRPNSTSCTLGKCTTPKTCPSQWSSWGTCDQQCRSFRSRSCEGCEPSCETNYKTSEMRYCEDCVTTPQTTVTTGPVCKENEVFDTCITEYENCMADCAVFRKSSVCDNLDNATNCIVGCRCVEGFRRNMLGDCVEDYNCECYDESMTTPIPMSYTVTKGLCEYCECYPTGFECRKRPDCCDLSPWSEWSSCSASCGFGERFKERSGPCDDPEEKRVIFETCHTDCPCIYDGKVMSPGETIEKNCEVCTCAYGALDCVVLEPEPLPWVDNCEKKCYCENGTERCHYPSYLEECRKIRENCTGEDYILRENPDEPCCPTCEKIPKPCRIKKVKNERLSFNGTTGLCVSDKLPIQRCEGSCGGSSSEMFSRDLIRGPTPAFKLIVQSECHCCQAEVGTREVSFSCPGEIVTLTVEIISGCKCTECIGKSTP